MVALASLLTIAVLSAAFSFVSGGGKAGKLDRSFGGDGVATVRTDKPFASGWGIGGTSDGEVVVGIFAGIRSGSVVKFKQGGALDRSFGKAGQRPLKFKSGYLNPRDLLVDRKNRVVVAGESKRSGGGDTRGGIARLHPNGAADRSFSGDGLSLPGVATETTPDEIAFSRGAGIVMVGSVGGTPARKIFVGRFLSNGRLDPSFSGNGYLILRVKGTQSSRSIAVDRRGRTVVGLGSTGKRKRGSGSAFSIFRFTKKGRPDSSFGGNGRVNVDPVRRQADQFVDLNLDRRGRIIAVGSTTGEDGSIARLLDSGRLDRKFAKGGSKELDMTPTNVSVDRRNRIIIVGEESFGGWDSAASIVRLRSGGAEDRSFSTITYGLSYFKDHYIDSSNRIVVSGAKGGRKAGAARVLNPAGGPPSNGKG